MGVPDSIKKQVDLAEAIQKQIVSGQNPPADPVPQANTPPVVSVVTPLGPASVTPPGTVIEPPPEAPAIPEPVAPIPQSPAPCENCSKQEHKYSVLQGKYDKEVPRLTYRIAFLENQIDDLKRQVAEPTASLASPNTMSAAMNSAIGEMLRNSTDEKTKTFRENFPDMFEFVANAADMIAGKTIQQTEKRLESVEQRNAVSAQEKFLTELGSKVPGWETICQEDPNWPVFLNAVEPYSGKKKLDLLKDASQMWNYSTVINLLKDFQKEFGTGTHPPSNPLTPTPPPTVFPPSGHAAALTSTGAQPEYIARGFISQFYQDVARGAYRGRVAEEKAIKAKIDQAVAKGLILNS